MDMDDPWGSPWADEIQHPGIATKEKLDSQLRPKTPVKAETLGLKEKTGSPWDDEDEDDGFGEWAALPGEEQEEVRGTALGLDGAGDAWETPAIGNNRGSMKEELNELEPGWNHHTTTPDHDRPKLAPSLMPQSAGIVRHHSPDPWSTETTLNDSHHKKDIARLEEHGQEVDDQGDLHIEKSENGLATDEVELQTGALTEAKPELEKETSEDGSDLESDQEDTSEPAHLAGDETNRQEVEHESSRPSSSPSDQSHHDDALNESPRTSLDEDPKRPAVPRKVSSKIQGLVEHFDGLAKLEEPAVDPGRSRSITPSRQTEKIEEEYRETTDGVEVEEEEREEKEEKEEEKEEDDDVDDDDFGDFEDGQSEVEESIGAREIYRPATPTPVPSQAMSRDASQTTSPQSNPSPRNSVKKDYGRVEFAADTSALNKLYPQQPGEDDTVETIFIPDMIPHDSFSSTEQRKTWYRISRYGSMRKHNSGNDDNYIRISWTQSRIRDQTLKTVARWMEEDRISGHVVLGGGSKGSSIFGWNDPNAPTVPLSSAFTAKQGKKILPAPASVEPTPEVPREWPKGLVKTHSTSKSRSPPQPKRQSSAKSARVSEDIKTGPLLPVANFGWNSSTSVSQESKPDVSIPLSTPVPNGSPGSMKSPWPPSQFSSSSSSRPPHPPNILIPTDSTHSRKHTKLHEGESPIPTKKSELPAIPPTFASISNDEDDDWGEMVSSPVIATPPVFSSSQGLHHKKSMSLGRAFSPAQASPIDSQITLPTLGRGHKSTMSFDGLLIPKVRSSAPSTSDPLLSNTPTTNSPSPPFSQATQAPQSTIPFSTNTVDPWASADFSFFDTVPAPPPQKPAPIPVSKPMPPKSVAFARAPPTPSPLRNGKTRQEIEQDQVVASIVKSLPDLSYMLRR